MQFPRRSFMLIFILVFYKIPSSNYFAVSNIVKFIYPMLDITLFSYYVYLVIMIIIILKLCLPVVCTGPYTKKYTYTRIFLQAVSLNLVTSHYFLID